MAITAQSVSDICRAAKRASRALARLDTHTKNAALEAMARALESRVDEILEANARDMEAGRAADLNAASLDKLRLDESRAAAMARGARTVVRLPAPVGAALDGCRLP